jgi:hypothetical protein
MAESKNNHILKNSNLLPGRNKKIVVDRGICNKPTFETRTFSTSAELITEDKGVQYQNDN